MTAKKKLKMMTLDQMKDKHFGKTGTPERDQYELKLKLDLMNENSK